MLTCTFAFSLKLFGQGNKREFYFILSGWNSEMEENFHCINFLQAAEVQNDDSQHSDKPRELQPHEHGNQPGESIMW